MTTEIYERIHGLIEGCMYKTRHDGNIVKYQAAKKRLADFERDYEEDYARQEADDDNIYDDVDPGCDPAFPHYGDFERWAYGY